MPFKAGDGLLSRNGPWQRLLNVAVSCCDEVLTAEAVNGTAVLSLTSA